METEDPIPHRNNSLAYGFKSRHGNAGSDPGSSESMEKRFGVLLIGCGHIGEEHLADIYYRENIRIVGAVDTRVERAALFARKYGAEGYGTDYRPFLEKKDTDIVIIATYADSHLAILQDCLAAGKHVLCEKPIAASLEDGLRFVRLVKSGRSRVLVAHILRHNRSYQKLAELIQGGVVGKLRLMRMVQNHHAIDWPRYKRLLQDCSPVVDCGVHYLDVMQWFTGARIAEVRGMSCRLDPDAPRDNYGIIEARLTDGCVGVYEAGWSRNLAAENRKEFVGDRGRLVLTLRENRPQNREEGDLIELYDSAAGEYRVFNIRSKYKDMYAQLSCLISMIEEGTPASPTIDEVYTAFSAAMLAERAMESHTALYTLEPSQRRIRNA